MSDENRNTRGGDTAENRGESAGLATHAGDNAARSEYASLRYPGDLALDIGVEAKSFPWRRVVIGAVAAMAAMVVLGTLTVGAIVVWLVRRPPPGIGSMPTAISLSLPSTGEVSLASAVSWSGVSLSFEGLPSVSGAGVSLPALPRVEAGSAIDESIHRGDTASTKERPL